jgi:hypothetical protein
MLAVVWWGSRVSLEVTEHSQGQIYDICKDSALLNIFLLRVL